MNISRVMIINLTILGLTFVIPPISMLGHTYGSRISMLHFKTSLRKEISPLFK